MNESGRLVLFLLHVSDLENSTHFYRDILGIPLQPGHNEPRQDPWMGGQHAEVSWRTGAYLHFSLFPAHPPERPVTKGAELGLLTDDLDRLHRSIVGAGVIVLHAPRDEPWGKTARYEDPDGNIVGITQTDRTTD